MVIKIDLEKACDRLRWLFIRETLMDMRLPHALLEVIMWYVTRCSLSILWNGDPTERLLTSRRIRQSDQLSPYLFVAWMEKLLQFIETEVSWDKWSRFPISRDRPKISTLFFCRWCGIFYGGIRR